MTTTEHRLNAALAIIASADGPLTPREIAGRLTALGHTCDRSAARRLGLHLEARGLLERILLNWPGRGERSIFWPTQLGRREAEALESQRIDGV